MIVLPDTPTISIEEAGALLGVSRRTAFRMARSGDLPTVEVYRTRRVPTALFLAKFSLAPAK